MGNMFSFFRNKIYGDRYTDNAWLGENICKWCDQEGINFQNKQTAHATQWQENKQPNQNMGRRPKETFP